MAADNPDGPGRHGPDVKSGPEGGELMQQCQAFVEWPGQTPDETSQKEKDDGRQRDKDDKAYRYESIDHEDEIYEIRNLYVNRSRFRIFKELTLGFLYFTVVNRSLDGDTTLFGQGCFKINFLLSICSV